MATEITNKYTMNTFINIIYVYILQYMMFINITISISENGINYNVFQVKTRYKIFTFSLQRRNSLNGVLEETTAANTRDRSSRVHAC